MNNERKIKIKVEDLILIFGKQSMKGLQLIKEGKTKQQIFKSTGCTVGVNRANLRINDGEIFVIMGLSGSGKSTLLRCLNRLISPTSGKIYINNDEITKKSYKDLLHIRRKEMSMVFQNFGLLPHRTVLENVAFGLELRKEKKEVREQKALKIIETVGLHGFDQQYPNQLSGGMQQRVGLARALANDPEILLMDESFSALDPLIKNEMQDELLQLQEKLQKTIVFITHDLNEAIKLGDRIAIMKDGRIEQIGTAEEILTRPATDYVKTFTEKVDRKTIITAASLIEEDDQLIGVEQQKSGDIYNILHDNALDVAAVTNQSGIFQGLIWMDDLIDKDKKEDYAVQDILRTEIPQVSDDATVEDMLARISNTKSPVAVTEKKSGRYLGLVTQNTIITEATRFNKTELKEFTE